jgi:hypothetical protein
MSNQELIAHYPRCGDGGNRTRVRKIRPADIYERSRLLLVVSRATTDKNTRSTSRWDPKAPLSHAARRGMWHSDFVTPGLPPVGGRGRRTWPLQGPGSCSMLH